MTDTPDEIRAEITKLEAEEARLQSEMLNKAQETPWFDNADPGGADDARLSAVISQIDKLYEGLKKKVQS